MKKILQLALVLTVVGEVCSEDENEVKTGMFVVSSIGTTNSTDVLARDNKTTTLLSFTNTGELVDGMINTNISNSNEIRSVFQDMKKLNIKTQCNILDYKLFVVKFCQEKIEEKDENQQKEEEPPKGTYSSNIKILQQTNFFEGVWTLRIIIVVEYKVRMSNTTAYEACSRKQMLKSLKKVKGVYNNEKEISHKRSQAETTVKKDNEPMVQHNGESKNQEKTKEDYHSVTSDNDNKSPHERLPFLRPIYIKITVQTTRKLADLEEGETLYYTIFEFQDQCVVVRAGKFKPTANISNKTTISVTGLHLVIEATAKEHEHTFLIYDNRFQYLQLPEPNDLRTKRKNRLTASYTCDVFNNVTLDKKANGTLFSFNVTSEQRNQGRRLDEIVMFISDETKKEDHSVKRQAISNHKVSLSGCFHVKTDANNTITHGQPVKIVETVKKIESCNLCPKVVEQWLSENLAGRELNTNAHQDKDFKQSKLVTCGTVTIEVSREDDFDSNGPIPKNVFVFYLNNKKSLNEDGKETEKMEINDKEKVNMRDTLMPNEESAKYAYETFQLLQSVFDKNVQNAIANIKQSITTKFGKGIWNTAKYMSELKISRNVACTDNSCQGNIKAVLQYNLTRKAMPIKRMHLQPKINFQMLVRFHFFGKFLKPRPLPTTWMKHLYNPKYRAAQKMSMIKMKAATPVHAAKTDMPTTLNKVGPKGSQKLHFKTKGKKHPFSVNQFPKFHQYREFLDYERKMGKLKNGPLKIMAPDFRASNKESNQFRDGEIIYDKTQQVALEKVEEDKPKEVNSGYALSAGKSITIVLVNCFFLLKL